jgi:hypothetical protein
MANRRQRRASNDSGTRKRGGVPWWVIPGITVLILVFLLSRI